MVYKLTAPEVKKNRLGILMLCLPYGVLVVVIAAVMGVVMEAGMVMVFLVSLLVAASVVVLLYAHMVKTIRLMQEQGDWFVTATEAGLMIEKPEVGMTSYFSWELVEKVLLKKTLLFVCLKNGMKYFLPLASLGSERARELHAYCVAFAGKPVLPEKQVAPPAEMLAAPALPCADGAAARQEVADELARQRAPFASWALLVCLAIMVSGLVVQVWCWRVTGEADIEGLVVAFVISLFCIRAILHPGWSLRKWVRQQVRSEAHIRQGMILVHTPGVAWSMLPVSLVRGARELRHCYAYAVQGGGVLGISRSVPVPAGLPLPATVKRWRSWLALLLAGVVVPALAALGMWCWVSAPSDSVDDEAGERGCALAEYVQELLPPGEFPGSIYWGALFDREDGGVDVIYLWENGMELRMLIPVSEPGTDGKL
ncbi:MAG: hypothetical protein E7032_00200 [Akkermansiaceae bacterium]|nr:hypothetical protein [Akkermansiaceae bacterium]